jgi:hypothetical protein
MISRKLVENLHELTDALERHDARFLSVTTMRPTTLTAISIPNSNPPDT